MEKRTAHCKLKTVKALVAAEKVRVTYSALQSAAALGFDVDGVLAVVAALTTADFFKSTTTYENHQVWQDVYRPFSSTGIQLYVKITVIDDVLIVSFKEK